MHACDEGGKRQLPSWMVQKVGVTATPASNSDNAVETFCSVKKGDIITAKAANKDHNREPLRKKPNLRAKHEVKGRKKLVQRDGSHDNVTQKKKGDMCKDRGQTSSLKKRKKLEDPSHGSFDVYPDQSSSDDAVELTVEDMMVIAKQYVKDYENKDRKEISSRQCESKWQFQVANETATTLDFPCENKNSSRSGRKNLSNSTSTTDELIATSTSQTGDPAQDMLDLFLGPLLRKTLEKEKSKSIVENIEIAHEFTRQSSDELARQEIVPLMKKRNTLKDKVAMFLDQDM
ncbi:hypothetical protein Fmac_022527 [Flemingia macrophylla]|uniref:Uncharacterized protein n=1 Tax=Flemingia macrophylla TaxID=520843 RepID=A0ABD1M002_9FABA